MIKKYLVFSILVIFTACAKISLQEQEIKNVIGKKLKLTMFDTILHGTDEIMFSDFRKKFKYISVVYLEDGCTPCYPKFMEWHKHREKIKSLKEYEVLFVIQGYNYDSFKSAVEEVESWYNDYYIIMDPYLKFVEHNDIPVWIMNSSLLIDSKNKIKSVGSPFASEKMESFFNRTISSN